MLQVGDCVSRLAVGFPMAGANKADRNIGHPQRESQSIPGRACAVFVVGLKQFLKRLNCAGAEAHTCLGLQEVVLKEIQRKLGRLVLLRCEFTHAGIVT